ncbi:DUF928 domain-containing protein [Pantanalinema rosaneae CENA516]|uniref:DUF928 domain-containing protein n=1 Tax=Pantanalinema rosaneae TaxID=1620701 RepID=UPI003D6DE2FD
MTRPSLLTTILGFMLIGTVYLPQPIAAQSMQPDHHAPTANTIPFLSPTPPDTGEPTTGADRGGSTRDPIVALVPLAKSAGTQIDQRWGLTTVDRPTFWFHLPDQILANQEATFTLRDGTGAMVYQTKFTTPATAPVTFKVVLPATVPPLAVHRSYRWQLAMELPEVDDLRMITGLVQRSQPSAQLRQQLATAKTPFEQAVIYAQHGIWYDALTIVGNEQLAGRHDSAIAAAWSDLLKQIKLQGIAAVPIRSLKHNN